MIDTATNEAEAIRIVPLHSTKTTLALSDLKLKKGDENFFTEEAITQASAPHLVYNGGAIIDNVEVFTIFWGNNWASTALYKTLATNINNFFSSILNSPLIDQLAEYNTSKPKHIIGHGKLTGTKTIAVKVTTKKTSIKDSAIQTALAGWIAKKTVPPTTGNTLYFIYTDINVKVIMGGSSSCTNFCGYHNNMGQVYYAVMPFPGCAGCLGGLSVLDALTGTSSHELCEAITDPVPGAGWYDQVNGEIGDICAWKFKKVAGYNVQLEWSNKMSNCI